MTMYACVTGADRGLGFALTKELLANGYVVFAGNRQKNLSGLEALRTVYPGRLELVELDIADDKSVRNAALYISGRTDRLDVLVNNAAILGDIETGLSGELDFDEMQRVFNVNSLGALRVTNSLFKLIVGGGKLVVNISSEAGSISTCWRKGWFAYCMSKAALNIQSALVHNELKEYGGQVMVIHPGWLRTNMRGHLDEQAPMTADDSAKQIMRLILDSGKYKGDKAVFMDYQGNLMQW